MLRMAPWVVRPRLPDPPPKGRATPDAVCKDYRRPAERAKVSGPVLLVEREVPVELIVNGYPASKTTAQSLGVSEVVITELPR